MRTVLVTGGAGGIGSAISKKFANEGYAVIITYRSDESKAKQILDALDGTNHSVFQCSTTDATSVQNLATAVTEKYESLDLLVNNAGITTPVAHHDLEGLSDEWIDQIFQTNFRGSFAMIRAFKDLLLINGSAARPSLVVNISSIAARTGVGSNVAYCASKAALDSMTRSLGRVLAPGIRVMSVSPGLVLGAYTEKFDPIWLQNQKDLTPLSRLATPEDVAKAVCALDTTLTFATGDIVPVDGGRPLN